MLRLLVSLFLLLSVSGCYYMQAAGGQWELMRKREPIDELIIDPRTPSALTERLRLIRDARDFSVAVLGLPDNKSYRSYTELERDYVVWNVFATPEFSLTPKHWCFPIAGCVSYRGYFSKHAAVAKAEQLESQGFDVAVGGVVAYSTLGKFSDPILSTMMRWNDTDLVAVLFHELAHQVVYVKDDSSFNESFASAVEEFGIERWLRMHGQDDDYAAYIEDRRSQRRVMIKIETARADLSAIYASEIEEAEMREQKHERLSQLASDVRGLSDRVDGELNNAHLVTSALYSARLPQFRDILERCEQRIECFYATVRSVAKLDLEARNTALATGKFGLITAGTDDR